MIRSAALLDTQRASTDDLPLDQRVVFWEQYNASTLVGLKCSSFSETGFSAREDNLSLDRLRVAHIVGNQHVIERDGSMIRTVPKESVFVSLVMIIILAVLALIVVKALAESPWGIFTVMATIPVAMFMVRPSATRS